MGRKFIVIVVLSVITVFCFGLQNGLAQSTPKRGGMAVIGMNMDVPTLDPHKSTAIVTVAVMQHVCEPLVGYGENLEFVPVLAERWEISKDYKTYTFNLRKGKLFHNGREMVADDVKYSFERIMDPKTKCPRAKLFKNVKNIEVIDKYTVRFHMKDSDASLLSSMAYLATLMAVVPREEVEKQGGILKHPVGTGPYKFVEWKPDRHIILERFDQYKPQSGPMNGSGGERIAYLDKIKFIPVSEESVAEMAILNKEVDFLYYVPFKSVKKFRQEYSQRGIVVDEMPGLSWYPLFFGCNKPITKDIKFRKACAYAIDRELVMKAATRGYAVVNSSFVANKNAYYSPIHKQWYKKDLAKAKQLLKETGYKGEIIPLYTTKKYKAMYAIAVAVQAELAAVGINTKLEVEDFPTHLKRRIAGNYQIMASGVGPRPDPALAYKETRFSGFDAQFSGVKEAREAASKTADFETRKKLFEKAHLVVKEGVPMIVFYNYNYIKAHQNYLKGYKITCTNLPRFWGVWVDK